ncbi:MAG: lipoprotein [Eikenella sp.]|nr:lipoprotein [Eikenella sp.]
MPAKTICILAAAVLLAACGYKGDLYLPKEGDQARFGPVQTGLQFSPPAPMPHTETPPPLPLDAE